ncbi:class III extradiol dioxygenase subunit B-like domain-containing protein [Micromonospora sp. DT4]|uniref:class III extradiol dioxygenase subunit B-like domain-containing protein n=1 Tax=Micromonospora sp. DT4 TaxID=3393438 RepID=UPI003CF3E332
MPLVAAAVCPHPPLLVPEVAGAAARELDDLRAACDLAVRRLLATAPDAVVLLGVGPVTGPIQPPATGSLQPWGVDLEVPLVSGQPDRGAVLPLSLTIGAWLLSRHAPLPTTTNDQATPGQAAVPPTPTPATQVTAMQVTADAGPAEVAALAAEVAAAGDRVALLVLGDGSACRGQKAPGYDDQRALPYDEGVAAALAEADVDALRDLDPSVSAQLKVAGRAAWQVLADAARASGGGWRGGLLHESAPYGVAYFVASWERM